MSIVNFIHPRVDRFNLKNNNDLQALWDETLEVLNDIVNSILTDNDIPILNKFMYNKKILVTRDKYCEFAEIFNRLYSVKITDATETMKLTSSDNAGWDLKLPSDCTDFMVHHVNPDDIIKSIRRYDNYISFSICNLDKFDNYMYMLYEDDFNIELY